MKHGRFWLVLALLLALVALQGWIVLPAVRGEAVEDDAVRVATVALSAPIPSWGHLGGVAADGLGFLYMANYADSVFRIAPGGTVETWATGLYGAAGNTIDHNGDLLQSSFYDDTIRRIDREGTMTTFVAEGLDGPGGIYAAPDGDVFVCNCEANTVVRIRGTGAAQSIEVVASGELFDCPVGIAGDGTGNVYVVNVDNDKLIRIAPDGTTTVIAVIEPAGGHPEEHIRMGVRGHTHMVFVRDRFYVTKIKTNSIWEVGLDGSVRHFAGNFRPQRHDGPLTEASIASPNGIAVFENALFFNTIVGTWRNDERTELELRKIELVPN